MNPGKRLQGQPALRYTLRGLRRVFRNWYILAPLAGVILPSRFPPRAGIRRLASRIVRVKFRSGSTVRCRVSEFWPFVEIFANEEYESDRIPWQSLRSVIDVGANVGAAALWFARRAPEARIVAVEPDHSALSLLAANVSAEGLSGRVEILPVAVTGERGQVFLNRTSGFSLLTRTSRQRGLDTPPVSSLTLTDLLERAELFQLDLLKLDCEGAEFEIIMKTPRKVLRRIMFIVGEYHGFAGDPEELGGFLTSAGFMFRRRGGSNVGIFEASRLN
jgi:FkbM family methyltransferase